MFFENPKSCKLTSEAKRWLKNQCEIYDQAHRTGLTKQLKLAGNI